MLRSANWIVCLGLAMVTGCGGGGTEPEATPVEKTASAPLSKWAKKLAAARDRLANGDVLLQERFDRAELGDAWFAEEGTWITASAAGRERAGVIGSPGTTYPDSFLWTRQTFEGDISVEFDALCLSEPAHDINFALYGHAPHYPPPETPLYLMGLGGWDNTMTGIERAPGYKWKALTGMFTIKKNTRYHVLAGRLGDYFYLFVDGQLIVEARDPNPLPAKGAFAFHVFQSTVRFENLVIRKPRK